MTEEHGATRDRIGGAALVVAAAGTMLAMAHHPSGGHGGALGGIVHGAMIALLCVIAFGFGRFAQRRGIDRPLILAGAIAYAVSVFAHIGAATINGFVVPAIAGRGQPVSHDIFLLAWEANQALARLGVIATGLAYVGWGSDLVRERGTRWLGLAGIAAGLIPAALLLTGAIRMDVAGAFIAYAAYALWAVLVGLTMWRSPADDGTA